MSGGASAQLARKEGEFIASTKREVHESLAGDRHFLLFMGWFLQRCGLTDAFYPTEGLAQFEGRRQVAVETLKEIQQYVPDVQVKILEARAGYETDLKRLSLTPEEKERAEKEQD